MNKPKTFTISPEKTKEGGGGGRGDASPGPGGYDLDAADKLMKPRNPEIRMGGKDNKPRDTSQDDIGPGKYGD